MTKHLPVVIMIAQMSGLQPGTKEAVRSENRGNSQSFVYCIASRYRTNKQKKACSVA